MNNIAQFYDQFISNQIAVGINDRIFNLYKRLIRLKVTKADTILEIGCGIGSLTFLLSRKVKKGKIEAIDISPKSISYAQRHLSKPNVNLSSGSILDYQPLNAPFDFILLFDVLEHVPIENHGLLFTKIHGWMHPHSRLLINIPNPEYIIYDQKNNPEVLQEIDQPIFIDHLASVLSKSSLAIEYFENYSVWVKNDYQFLIVKKKVDFKEEQLTDTRTLFKKLIVWLSRKWRKYFYKYQII